MTTLFCSTAYCDAEATHYFRTDTGEVYAFCESCHDTFMWGQSMCDEIKVWPNHIDNITKVEIVDYYITIGWDEDEAWAEVEDK